MEIDRHVRDEIDSIVETREVEDRRGNIENLRRLAPAVLFAAMVAASIGEAAAAAAYNVGAMPLNWW